jgi:hypothetical protein
MPLAQNHDALLQKGFKVLAPREGYSYWLSLNPRSPRLTNVENRRWLQKLLGPDRIEMKGLAPTWTRAHQLYLPDGPGRPSETELRQFWSQLESRAKPAGAPTVVNLLLSSDKYPFLPLIEAALNREGIQVHRRIAASFDDFLRQVANPPPDVDLFLINNDLSGPDLTQSIDVTFDGRYPLIPLQSESTAPAILKEIRRETSRDHRQRLLQKLALLLLQDANIIPIGYFNVVYYYSGAYDASEWSTLFSDVALWRLKTSRN